MWKSWVVSKSRTRSKRTPPEKQPPKLINFGVALKVGSSSSGCSIRKQCHDVAAVKSLFWRQTNGEEIIILRKTHWQVLYSTFEELKNALSIELIRKQEGGTFQNWVFWGFRDFFQDSILPVKAHWTKSISRTNFPLKSYFDDFKTTFWDLSFDAYLSLDLSTAHAQLFQCEQSRSYLGEEWPRKTRFDWKAPLRAQIKLIKSSGNRSQKVELKTWQRQI